MRGICCAVLLATLALFPSLAFSLPSTETPSVPRKKGFTAHFRGTSGQALAEESSLPKTEKVDAGRNIESESITAESDEGGNETGNPPALSISEFTQSPVLYDCSESSKNVDKFSGVHREAAAAPELDILIMRKDEVPEDRDVIFGKTVEVIGFDDRSPNPSWLPVNIFEIKCLPSRVRVFEDRMELYTGMDALLNFDLGKHGKLHEYVVAKYGKGRK